MSVTKQTIQQGESDLMSLASVINGDEQTNGNGVVITRTGSRVKTLRRVLYDIASFNPRGAWAQGTVYAVKDLVQFGGVTYFATVNHTAGSAFNTDLNAKRWAIHQGDVNLRVDLASLAGGGSLVVYAAKGAGATMRSVGDRLADLPWNVAEFGGAPGTDIADPILNTLAAIGTNSPATLIIPGGRGMNYTVSKNIDISNYRLVTIVIEPGAIIDNGTRTVVLPERVSVGLGSGFIGSGDVSQKNKDQALLQQPGAGHVVTGNMAKGLRALAKNIGGYSNFARGNNALAECKWGRGNFAWGNDVLSKLVGDQTGARATIDSGEIISYNARGDANWGSGNTALRDLTTGCENLAIGDNALQQLTTGLCNVALGAQSQITNNTGNFNVSVGAYTLVVNKGNNNLALGWAALEGQTSGSNIAIGHAAMNGNKTGTLNVAIGILALGKSQASYRGVVIGQEAAANATSGNDLTVMGAYALGQMTNGGCNGTTAIGSDALLMLITGDNNSALGHGALSNAQTVGNCFGIGADAQVTGSNQGQLGNTNVTTYHYGIQARSDKRDKDDIRDTVLGLDFIRAVRPVDYRWNMRDDYRNKERPRFDEPRPVRPVPPVPLQDGADEEATAAYENAAAQYESDFALYQQAEQAYDNKYADWCKNILNPWQDANRLSNITRGTKHKRARYHHGVIAQEVQALIAETGVDFGGFQDHAMEDGGDDVLTVSYEEFVAPLIKSVQQLSEMVETLTARVAALEAKG